MLPSISDLSEQIKAATKDNHVRAENTKLMLSYQKGQITLPQYKVNSTHQHMCVLQDRSHHTFCSICVYTVLKSGSFCLCQVLLCSLYEIYKALEEELDRNSSHPAVAPIYFPQELARLETLERDLEHFLGSDWRKRVIVPAATHRYEQRLRKVSTEEDVQLMFRACLL